VPLKARDRVIGVLAAGNKSGRPFSDRDQAMLTAVADYAVIAIVNGRLFQAMEARARQLQQGYEAQVAENVRKDETTRRIAQQMRGPMLQARGSLDALAQSAQGSLLRQQIDQLVTAQDRLAVLERLLDELLLTPGPMTMPK
jgi:GAF domain-containing protein